MKKRKEKGKQAYADKSSEKFWFFLLRQGKENVTITLYIVLPATNTVNIVMLMVSALNKVACY